jgi:cell wall assembly regulator SMI1
MQKFTRALTREIELAGHRLKVTLDEKGIAVSPVGSRRPPREISWNALVHLIQNESPPEPDPHALGETVEAMKGSTSTRKPRQAASQSALTGSEHLPELLARLEAWFKSHRPRYAAALNPPATEADLEALRGSLNAEVPDELRQLLAWHNGQSDDFAGAFEDAWSLMSTGQIAEAKRQLDAQAGQGQTGWQAAWIPFLDDDSGNYLCLDPGQAGVPVREYRSTGPEAPTLAPSLTAWLRDFVRAVEKGQYHEDPERGQFIKGEA